MAFRLTRVLAALALAACIVGILPAASVLPDARLLWALVPILSAAGVVVVARRRGLGLVWVLIGASCGFVVLAAWSIGPFFAPSALLLVMTGVTHVSAVRARWRAVFIPAWFLAGPTGLCAVFFARDQVLARSQGREIMDAPAIVTGTWVLAALVLLLVLAARAQSRWLGQDTPD